MAIANMTVLSESLLSRGGRVFLPGLEQGTLRRFLCPPGVLVCRESKDDCCEGWLKTPHSHPVVTLLVGLEDVTQARLLKERRGWQFLDPA